MLLGRTGASCDDPAPVTKLTAYGSGERLRLRFAWGA